MVKTKEWEHTIIGVDSVDWEGHDIILEDVPAERTGGEVRVRIDDIMQAEHQYLAKKYELDPINIHELMFLYADPHLAKRGYIDSKFRFNKMLFYQWKLAEKIGYGDSYIYDEFASARAGPVPQHLKEDMVKLQEKGLVELTIIKDGKKIASGKEAINKFGKPNTSIRCQLTKSGEKIAESIWHIMPDDMKAITVKVKKDLFFIDSTQLKEKVHKDYPEYKRNYLELDAE